MKTLVLTVALLTTSPVWAQSKPGAAATAATRVDPCAPIGRTSDGRLVYGMTCENLPAPPPRADNATAPAERAVAPAQDEDQGGLFRNPFPSLMRPSNVERSPGIGPAGGR